MKVLLHTTILVAALLQGVAAAQSQYGTLISTIDLDGDGRPESIYNNLSSINVVSNGVLTNYNIGFTAWSLLYGDATSIVDLDGVAGAEIPVNLGNVLMTINHRSRTTARYQMPSTWAAAPGGIVDLDGIAGAEITVVGPNALRIVTERTRSTRDIFIGSQYATISQAITDLDGLPGAEIPIAVGNTLSVYTDRTGVKSDFFVASNGNWAVCTTGSACVSDLDGNPGAELVIVTGPNMYILKMRSSGGRFGAGLGSPYFIGQQFAILNDGVREFDGVAGNDIAISRNDGALLVLRPANGVLQMINGAGTFGTSWQLLGYGNFDGAAGDEIRVQSFTNRRNYRISPRNGSVSAE